MFPKYVGLEQVIEDGGILCFGAKWQGDATLHFYSEWEHGQEDMIRAAHALLSEADATVTYNGNAFDHPYLNGAFLANGLKPPAPSPSIDVYRAVRKMQFTSRKLAFIGPFLRLGKKVKHEGFKLWVKVLEGDEKAQKRMQEYCSQDVKLLERVYNKIKPYITNHPNLHGTADSCSACGSTHLQKRGFRFTRLFKVQRLQCQKCGHWQTGAQEKIK